MVQFGIGQPATRLEDPRLITGKGRYVADVTLPGEVYGHVLRSPYAHAGIKNLNIDHARTMPGVLLILSGKDYVASGLGTPVPTLPYKRKDGTPAISAPQPLLVKDRVRFVGDNIVFIIAETAAQAKDAAEQIEISFEALDVIVTPDHALHAGAPVIRPDCPDNVVFTHALGDKQAADAAFARADHIVHHKVAINRIAVNAMETRGCIAQYEAKTGRYCLRFSGQNPHFVRSVLAEQIFRQPIENFRVIAEEVGGGFGVKAETYPEYALCLWAAQQLQRPVKWISERSESFLCDTHARELVSEASLALDANGNFLALRVLNIANIGAYFTSDRNGVPPTQNLGGLAGTYTIPAIDVEVTAVFTNTATLGPYRGAGRPEASYILESTIDQAARQLDIDAAELRRRNTIPADAMPYKTALVFTYDCGDFAENLEICLDQADYGNFEQRRDHAFARGKLRGIGIANTIERAGAVGLETAEIRFDNTGQVTLLMGTKDHGQGHKTTFSQILSEYLGVDADKVQFIDGDTDQVFDGNGTFGSRSISLGGAALVKAAGMLIEKGKAIAAHLLEANVDDILFADGIFAAQGTNKTIDIVELAKLAHRPDALPDTIEHGFEARGIHHPEVPNYPNGCYICELEIDAETGSVELMDLTVVDDVGKVINPLLLKGQIYGGLVQGIGQALMEDLVIDRETGQILAGSFTDYCMPRADDLCNFTVTSNEVPTLTNPLGVKGAGEAGAVGALPAVMNAINNALAPLGADYVDMPATPQKLWRAIQTASGREQMPSALKS
jgi:aerobic carbon-monoxide dehydrogenase large subunit